MVSEEKWDILLFRMLHSAIGSSFQYIIEERPVRIVKLELDLYGVITL